VFVRDAEGNTWL